MSLPTDVLQEVFLTEREQSKGLKENVSQLNNEVDRLRNELNSARDDEELTRIVVESKRELQSRLDAANSSIEQIQHARKELDQKVRDERRYNAGLQALLEELQHAFDDADRSRASHHAEESHEQEKDLQELKERLAEKEQRRLRQRINNLEDQLQSRLDDHKTAIDDKDAELERGHLRYESLDRECDELTDANEGLKNEVTTLQRQMANLKANRDHLFRIVNESRANAGHLDRQPQSSSPSLKRNHDHLDSEEEETSSVDPERIARRLEKAPRREADVTADGLFSPLDDSTGAERGGSSGQALCGPADSRTDSARPRMNVSAPSSSRTANPSMMLSDSGAFTISVDDAKHMNFSSNLLPDEILDAVRTKFRNWNQDSKFKWSEQRGNSCLECRSTKRKSEWIDGPEHACASCEQRMHLCLVFNKAQQVVQLLPRKAAIDEGQRPEDTTYWRR